MTLEAVVREALGLARRGEHAEVLLGADALQVSVRVLRLFAAYASGSAAHEERVDLVELVDVVREAVGARNGWKRILARCAPTPSAR